MREVLVHNNRTQGACKTVSKGGKETVRSTFFHVKSSQCGHTARWKRASINRDEYIPAGK